MKGKYTKKSMLMRFLEGSLHLFALSILSSAAVAALDLAVPQIIRIVVDYCLMGDPGTLPAFVIRALDSAGGPETLSGKLWAAAAAVIIAAALSAVFRYLNTYLNTRGTEKMVKTARDMLYEHIERLPFSWHDANQTGDIIQRCTSDVQTVREFVSEQLVQVIRIVILIVFSVTFMMIMSVRLSMIVFLSVPILVGYSYYFYMKIGSLFLECDENEGVLSTIAQENLTGVRVVRAFGREEYERERFRKQNRKYTDAWMSLCRILSVYWASGDLLMFVQVMVIVAAGAALCVHGKLTAGALIAFVSYNNNLIWPVRRLGRMLSEMSKAGVSMDRLLYILNSDGEKWDGTLEPDMSADIVFEDVTFGYNEKKIVDGLSLTIPGGSTVGVLGMTGSGKTTLMHLLNGLYTPDSGRITIGGTDIRDISLPWLRRNIGMVLQEPYLFSRTLGENIAIAADGSMDDIMRAADTAALDESVKKFDKGYDTMVGERGVTLSGGQMQRTAIARMILQDPPVMIFDDSLSSVDAETDEKIRARLADVTGRKTVILISHRISTLMEADLIAVIEGGRIVERGTHEQLMNNNGLYKKIHAIQNPGEGRAS